MISTSGLKMSFGNNVVLNTSSINFEERKVHGIIGLNGTGKTTFFNLLAGFLKADAGAFLRGEKHLTTREIGFLETVNYFYSGLTGNEYLRIFPATNERFNLAALNNLLLLPLDEVVESYSTGMKKKLALLAIIRQDKPIYIFDEPFNGLDLDTNKAVEIIIDTLKEKGKTVFISSHILSPLLATCNEIHLLQKGAFMRSYNQATFNTIENDLFADFNLMAKEILHGAL